jgi:hypothetical protein
VQIADETGLKPDIVLDAYAALLRQGYNIAGRML